MTRYIILKSTFLIFFLLPLISFSQRSVKESFRSFCPTDFIEYEQETFFDEFDRPTSVNAFTSRYAGQMSEYRSEYIYENSTIRRINFFMNENNLNWIKFSEQISYLDATDRIIKIEYFGLLEEEWISKGSIQIQYTTDDCITEIISDFTNPQSFSQIQILYPNGCHEFWQDDLDYIINDLIGHTFQVERMTTDSGYLEIQHRPGAVSNFTYEKRFSHSGKIETEKSTLNSPNVVLFRIDYEYDEQDGLINETHSRRHHPEDELEPQLRLLYELNYAGTWIQSYKTYREDYNNINNSWHPIWGPETVKNSLYCDGSINQQFTFGVGMYGVEYCSEYLRVLTPAPDCDLEAEPSLTLKGNTLNIYPNPSVDFINIESELMAVPGAILRILSSDGRQLYRQVLGNSRSKVLDVSQWSQQLIYVYVQADKANEGAWVRVE